MSRPEMALEGDKRKVFLSICQYIINEIENSPSADTKESLNVALQCLGAAYDIDYSTLILSSPDVPNLWNALVPESLLDASEEADKYKQEGNDFMAQGCFNEAIESYTKAIEINSQNAIYYCNRAAAHSRLDNHDACIVDCIAAIKLEQNYAKAYGRLGYAYLSTNFNAQAMDAYGTAIQLDPSNDMYRQNFETAAERFKTETLGGQSSNASENANTSANSNPRNPESNSGTATTVQSAINQIVNNPNLLSMASEMLSDESVRNAMTGLIQMQAQNAGNPSMESLLVMGQQLAHQMQQDHPAFIDNLRRHFTDDQCNVPGHDHGCDGHDHGCGGHPPNDKKE